METINDHLDKVLKEAPTKLKVSVEVSDADWQKMQKMLDEHNKDNTIRFIVLLLKYKSYNTKLI